MAQCLVSVLGLEGSSRSKELLKWNETGDLSLIVYHLIQDSVLKIAGISILFINL